MTHQVDQLKEEISAKESALVKLHLEQQRIEKEKDTLKVQILYSKWWTNCLSIQPTGAGSALTEGNKEQGGQPRHREDGLCHLQIRLPCRGCSQVNREGGQWRCTSTQFTNAGFHHICGREPSRSAVPKRSWSMPAFLRPCTFTTHVQLLCSHPTLPSNALFKRLIVTP